MGSGQGAPQIGGGQGGRAKLPVLLPWNNAPGGIGTQEGKEDKYRGRGSLKGEALSSAFHSWARPWEYGQHPQQGWWDLEQGSSIKGLRCPMQGSGCLRRSHGQRNGRGAESALAPGSLSEGQDTGGLRPKMEQDVGQLSRCPREKMLQGALGSV